LVSLHSSSSSSSSRLLLLLLVLQDRLEQWVCLRNRSSSSSRDKATLFLLLLQALALAGHPAAALPTIIKTALRAAAAARRAVQCP
jgi:hypothetical protein